MPSADSFLDEAPVKSADSFLDEDQAFHAPSAPGWIQNELDAASDQQRIEADTARTAKIGDAMRVVDAAMKLPGKLAIANTRAMTGQGLSWPTDEEVSAPLIKPEWIQRAIEAEGTDFVTKEGESDTALPKVIQGIGKGIGTAATGLTSPENLALLPLGAGKTAAKLLATVFAAKAAEQMPEQWKAFNATDDPGEKAEIATTVIAGLVPALAPLLHGGGKVKAGEVPKETGQIHSEAVTRSAEEFLGPDVQPIPPNARPLGATSEFGLEQEGPPTATEAKGLPIAKSVTQRYQTPEGAPIEPEGASTAQITRDALAWRKELLDEGARLGEQLRTMQEAGHPAPRPLRDRIAEINAELQGGYQPPKEPTYELKGDTEDTFAADDELADTIESIRSIKGETEHPIQPATAKPIRAERPDNIPKVREQIQEQQGPVSDVGIAHRFGEDRFEGEIERGEGTTVEAQVERGRNLLKRGVDPDQIIRRVDRTGRVSGDDMAVLRAKLEELQFNADSAAEAARINSDPVLQRAAEQAMQNELAWRKAIKPAATAFHEIGMTLQGSAEVNYGTFEGLRRSAFDLHGKDLTPEQAGRLKGVADNVRRQTQLATESLQRATTQVERTFGRKKAPRSVEQLRNDLANRMRELTPC